MIKYKLIYNRKNKLKKDGTGLVQLELYKDRTRKYITTEIAVSPEHWNERSSRINYSHPRSEEFNLILDDLTQQVNTILRKGKLLEEEYTIDDVINLLNHAETNLLSDFITNELNKDQRLKQKTITDLLNTRNRLIEFRPEAKLQDINYKFLVDLDNYLRNKGYSINTIGKLHKNLKRFLNLAINYNLISPNDYPYRNFRVTKESTDRESLTMDEVDALSKLQYVKGSVNDVVKDMFLLACYTGLRISDVIRLKSDHCIKSPEGWVLHLKTYKVGKMAYIPIHSLFNDGSNASRPETIINEYYGLHKELLFPKLPESKINRHLKEIAKEAGIDKNVTFHMGRHTFGTLMASKIALPTLQILLQHSDIRTTMIYVNMSKQMVDESLGKVDWNN